MADAAVARLKLRARPERAALATHRLTDALRLAPAGPERLLVVRRLALGRLPLDGRPSAWEARANEALAERQAQAVHGAIAGAEVEAVWFRSVAEARTLLLLMLASGRRPTAWFWRLAVPDWAEAPLDVWLPRWIARAAEPAEAAALARAVIAVAEAGDLPRLMAAVRGSGAMGAAPTPVASARSVPIQAPSRSAGPAGVEAARARAAALLARLPEPARGAVIEALAAARPAGQAQAWLARIVGLAVAPELGFTPGLLAETAIAMIEAARPRAQRPGPQGDLPLLQAKAAPPLEGRGDREAGPPSLPPPAEDAHSRIAGVPHKGAPEQTPPPVDAPVAAVTPAIEQITRLAGLFLLIRPLERIGLGDWLADRPDLSADGFARGLLRTIASRMGAREDDPVLVALAGEDDRAWTGALTAWRVGLDRWLRRRARIRLAEVVRRPGGLLITDDGVEVRFGHEAADVRLRRLGLDLDPYWTPWLGLAVRYHYRDEPLA